MRILVAGDTHHNRDWCATLSKLARRHACPYVLQLGDFGFWPRWKNKRGKSTGESFLDGIADHAARNGVEWVFIDGNHDDHASLRALVPDNDGFVTVRPHVRYAPRGLRWEWDSITFGALGGALTLDAVVEEPSSYTRGLDWFPDLEQVTAADVDRLGTEELDVLVCHEVPDGVPLRGWRAGHAVEMVGNQSRVELRHAVDATRPRLVLHGHWHLRLHAEITWADRLADVEGFAADIQGDHRAWGVLDLDTLAFIDVRDGSPPFRG